MEHAGLLVGGGGGLAQLLLPLLALGGGRQQGAGHQGGPAGRESYKITAISPLSVPQ